MDKIGGRFCFLWFWARGSVILAMLVGGIAVDVVFEAI